MSRLVHPRTIIDGMHFVASGLQLTLYFWLYDNMVHSTMEGYAPSSKRIPYIKGGPHKPVNSVFLFLVSGFLDLFLCLLYWLVMATLPLFGWGLAVALFINMFRCRDLKLGLCHLGVLAVFLPSVGCGSYILIRTNINFTSDEDVAELVVETAAVYICLGIAYLALVGGVIVAWRRICRDSKVMQAYRAEQPWTLTLLVFASMNFCMLFWFFVYGYDFVARVM